MERQKVLMKAGLRGKMMVLMMEFQQVPWMVQRMADLMEQ